MEDRKYGLQIRGPKQVAHKRAPVPSLFAAQDDEEEDTVERQLAREAGRSKKLQQAEEQHRRALEEDPNIFDYDGEYDKMKASQRRPSERKEENKSRYIPQLMEKARLREMEQELVYERKLARERALEDDMYKDKEKLITSSYKKELEKRRQFEEELKRQEQKEKAEDVTKRGDMTDFYFNFHKNEAYGGRSKASRNTSVDYERKEETVPKGLQQQQEEVKDEQRHARGAGREDRGSEAREAEGSPSAPPPPPPSAAPSSSLPSALPSANSSLTSPLTSATSEADAKVAEEEARKAREAAARERYLARKKART